MGKKLIRIIRNPIDRKAIKAVFIKSRSIPSLSKRPITLNGIPYLIRGKAIVSESFGFLLPIKKPVSYTHLTLPTIYSV